MPRFLKHLDVANPDTSKAPMKSSTGQPVVANMSFSLCDSFCHFGGDCTCVDNVSR